ncbi:MAG: hypothetical protein OXL96_01860 [Candidatus Poribacteria bacterium]|nr:hypothetical protein [Candidatus Poribacteria bacterium]
MKLSTVTLFYLVCFLGLLTFFGCGSDTEDTEETSGLIAERPEPEKTDDIYIPDKWYKTRDPLLRNDYFLAVLIKQFGDIPEVHTIADYQRKKIQGLPTTVAEYNAVLDARKRLWPDRETPRKVGALEEIDDPEEYAKIFREELIEQFGDVPEIDIIVEVEKKWKAGKGVPMDEYVDYAHAIFLLFPNKTTLRQFQEAQEDLAEFKKAQEDLAEQEEMNDLDDE